jgi:uncharacterized phiE125 gp8 family phage protein
VTLTLTLYDAKTGGVIGLRNAQTVLNANGGTVHATSGLFTMTFTQADLAMVTATEDEELHVAIFQATWAGGGTPWREDLWVRNMPLTATIMPPLKTSALLTLAEARDAVKLTTGEQNAKLATLINMVSDRFESETGRRLKSRAYTGARFSASGESVLVGAEWPITAVASASVSLEAQTLWVPGDVTDPDDFDVVLLDEPERRHLYRRAGWGYGLYHVQVTYTAGYGVAAAPIPGDLREAAAETLRHFWYIGDRQQAAVASRSSGMESITYVNTALPAEVLPVLRSYRRWS